MEAVNVPLQLQMGTSLCKPAAMPSAPVHSAVPVALSPHTTRLWLGDRGKPAPICLRAARRKGRATFPHLCSWKCQNSHLTALLLTATGCSWECSDVFAPQIHEAPSQLKLLRPAVIYESTPHHPKDIF